MDPTTGSFKRFWEPSYFTAMGLSLFAGTIATAITHPLEYLKTVIQFRSEGVGFRGKNIWYHGYNPHKILRQMHATGGGLMSLYGGFQANLYSRLSYLVLRNTLYKVIYDTFKPQKATNDLTSREKAVIGGIAGGIAAYITTPFALISIRQILDSQIKAEWRRNYNGISQGLTALKKQNAQFKGSWANVLRHVMLNVSLTGPYDYWHETLWIRFGDYAFVQPLALMFATLTSSIITLPFDNIRTRLMNSHSDASKNRMNYSGIFDAIIKSVLIQKHPRSLWAGFYTYFVATYLYATLTVGITREFTESWKKKEGLQDWKI